MTLPAFRIDKYYVDVFEQCNKFLCSSGGSTIPKGMKKIDLFYSKRIFTFEQTINIKSNKVNERIYNLKLHGEGSYALVYRYKDEIYDKYFIVKRAKEELTDKELERFKREYNTLKSLNSPYVVEVYYYDLENNQYVMEYMDYTLEEYISKNNQWLNFEDRKRLFFQILRAIQYIHSKKLLHRDISPNNVLLKEFDDGTIIVKIADFGLVKKEDSKLTSLQTEFKGSFNDPSLLRTGFESYGIKHEIYAITYLCYFIFTGRRKLSNTGHEQLDEIINKGMNSNLSVRHKDIVELEKEVKGLRKR